MPTQTSPLQLPIPAGATTTQTGPDWFNVQSAVGVTVVLDKVFPSAPAAANSIANATLPYCFRVIVTANNANPTTYTVVVSTLSG